ncbi:hypothetical protein [Chromobacterium violaceum]|uniref:Uncharacterized protein n=1 Tax=Chromobacterium violaceum (strain ATCC 12472 / DSM 30191 / JCM 1249 / CCUG 213 / NBRC 12614 / NCIMB 9131 / NCTC 9757 / MK) TaxID=243365 RepID=Q7NW77_CHRVO|nr:hypothetical protein [Chromobacterium violaceum]AAQ59785.1 hypothetical protein CV_2113 [Chromobacterium violaceum ATCC 12472]SUX35323.1 Uncharacterised protein [Chromobacterium violaceum]
MSLESSIADLIRASTDLTGTVRGKSAEIDGKVVAKINEMETWKADARGEYPVINVFENNLLWNGAAAGVESGKAGMSGVVPAGFYAWIANAEIVIQGTRQLVPGENGFTLPFYCPGPTVLRMKYIPKPNSMDMNNGMPYAPLPFAWGYPMPIAGNYVTHVFYARLVSGAASVTISNGQVIDDKWRKIIARHDGNDGQRAHWSPVMNDFTTTRELEFMLPHTYLGWIPDTSLPVYARAIKVL